MASIATLSTVNALTKEIYQGKIREQMLDEVVGMKRIERSSAGVSSEFGGKYVTFPIRVSRNAGIGYREEDETLQDPGTQGYKRVNIGLKYGYGRVKISGQAMELAESNPQAFASALDNEMRGLKNDLAIDSARIFYGDGTGAFATATGAKTGQVVPVSQVHTFFGQIGAVFDIVSGNGPISGKEHPAYVDPNTEGTLLNAPLNTYPSGGSLIASKVVLSSIDVANSTVTFVGTLGTVANGNLIVRTGNYLREPYGLSALVGTSKLFNLDDPIWQSVLNANGGTARPLSEGLMIKMTDDIRMNGGNTSLILTSLGVRRAYFALLSQQRRYTNTKEFGGGMTGLAFNNGREIPVVEDPMAPPRRMWFLDESAFKIYRDKDWSWLDTDGGIWKWVQNKDAFEAVMKQYWQIGLDRRNSQGLLSDITEG